MDGVGATAAGGADISADASRNTHEAASAPTPDPGPGARTTRVDHGLTTVAAALAAVSVLCCAATLWLHPWVGTRADIAPLSIGDVVLGSVWPVVGALVVRARPRAA